MIQKRHPVCGTADRCSVDRHRRLHLSGTAVNRERLPCVRFAAPTWVQIADSLRPNRPVEDGEPGVRRHGWQYFASQAVEDCFFSARC